MQGSAINNRKAALLPVKCQEQVGAAQEHRLGAQLIAEITPYSKKNIPLCLGDLPGHCHVDIVIVHQLTAVCQRHNHLKRSQAAIKVAVHDFISSDQAHTLQSAKRQPVLHFCDQVTDWQCRKAFQFLNTKMPGDGCDGNQSGTCCLQPPGQCSVLRAACP